jgi:hypothetical protein
MDVATKTAGLTVAIPTYCREQTLLETIHHIISFNVPGSEILVLDQSASHIPHVETACRRPNPSTAPTGGELEKVLGEILGDVSEITITTKVGIPRPLVGLFRHPTRVMYRR